MNVRPEGHRREQGRTRSITYRSPQDPAWGTVSDAAVEVL